MTSSAIAPPALTPQWFTLVMGTGMLATAALSLPVHSQALVWLARAAWALAAALLVVVGAAILARYLADRSALARQYLDPTIAPFFGAAPMALLTVGAGALLLAGNGSALHAAVVFDVILWLVGSALGFATAVMVPACALRRRAVTPASVSPIWLMPVVPPMVSAATGALLVAHLPSHLARAMALCCFAMFGASALAALLVIAAVWSRLAQGDRLPRAAVPALLIVLGPLGQSVTAAGALADHAGPALGVGAGVLTDFAIRYGVPVFGMATLWLGIAVAMIAEAVRKGLPFTLAWWSFTFPVGTCVTAAASLSRHTGWDALAVLAVALFATLLAGWSAAAAGTVRILWRTRFWAQPVPSTRLSRATQPGPAYTNAV